MLGVRRRAIRRKKRLRRQSQGRKAELRRDADREWTALILRRDLTCQVRAVKTCTGQAWLQAHHIIRRRYRGARWAPANGLAACRGCHHWLHHICLDEPQWYRDHGIDYDGLRLRAEAGGKGLDMALVTLSLRRESCSEEQEPQTGDVPFASASVE